uniref:Sugar phosphate transporter domain-containing protein n=1 Tax=Amphora coffeiformis TaxID=265554 RepID=A0A7S3P634_9STRA
MLQPSAASTATATTTSTTTDGESTPRYGLANLALCALGICVCYLYYGILQERLFTGRQRLGASFVLTTQCVTNAIVAWVWAQVEHSDKQDERTKSKASTPPKDPNTTTQSQSLHHWLLFVTSGFYVGAMACSNEAIQYVSYPVAVLAKSCKLIPTMLVGQLMESKLYSTAEWSAALLISTGIVLFHLTRHVGTIGSAEKDQSTYGMFLLLASLGMDGVLSSCQNFLKFPRNKTAHRSPTAVETMLYINLYAVVYLWPMCVHNGQWSDGVLRLQSEDSLVTAILILNATVALGQIFIFLCLTWFSPLYTTTITTTRKFLTVVISVLLFGHSFTMTQWFSVVLVFSGLYLIIAVQRTKSLHGKQKED